jgi:MOSC domain-containing protein
VTRHTGGVPITVTALAVTPVKGMRLRGVDAVELSELGARGNRAFYVIDSRHRLMNGKGAGKMQAIVPEYDVDAGDLTFSFPSGEVVSGHVELGDPIQTDYFGSIQFARELLGPWAEALSAFMEEPVRVVAAPGVGADRGRAGSVSLMSRASLRRLAEVAGSEPVDGRRFRMLIEVEGADAHAEDDWVRHKVRVGPALVEFNGHVGRCATTTRDPETGVVTFPTLHALAAYRKEHRSEEPLPFGIYGEVLEGGRVAVGDEVTVDGR